MVENCGLLSFLKQANKRILGKSSLNQAMGNSGEVYCGVKLIRPWLIFELGQSGMGEKPKSLRSPEQEAGTGGSGLRVPPVLCSQPAGPGYKAGAPAWRAHPRGSELRG